MITYSRANGKMPNCGRCKTPMVYWDLRDDESTYRCEKCEDIERGEFWSSLFDKIFKKGKNEKEIPNI